MYTTSQPGVVRCGCELASSVAESTPVVTTVAVLVIVTTVLLVVAVSTLAVVAVVVVAVVVAVFVTVVADDRVLRRTSFSRRLNAAISRLNTYQHTLT